MKAVVIQIPDDVPEIQVANMVKHVGYAIESGELSGEFDSGEEWSIVNDKEDA